MKEKPTYKGFIIWLVFFIASMIPALRLENRDLAARLCFGICLIDLVILMLIIYWTERIYWFSGISFEQARQAGSQQRKNYALKILKRFVYLLGIYLLFAFIGHIWHFHILFDMGIVIVGLIATCFSTFHITL